MACCQGAFKKGQAIAEGITYSIIGKNEELYKHRVSICKTAGPEMTPCKNFITGPEICARCGCPLETKGRVTSEKCPINKW